MFLDGLALCGRDAQNSCNSGYTGQEHQDMNHDDNCLYSW